MKPTYTMELTRSDPWFTTITVWRQGCRVPTLFRGDGISQWHGNYEDPRHPPWLRAHGKRICWAEWLHDGMEGWHTCVLHAGGTLAVLPRHPDYGFVAMLWALSDLPDREVIRRLRLGR